MVCEFELSKATEINASPSVVRDALLNFSDLPNWSQFIKSIEVTNAPESNTDAKPDKGPLVGSGLKVEITGMTFYPVVVSNTPEKFSWHGKLLGDWFFGGTHFFKFEELPEGKCKLTHGESFKGVLFPLYNKLKGAELSNAFGLFNDAIKKKVEADQ
ncbi:hypothetical protein DASC09_023900 [Saccharomycopsis crataegensis]|uniref:Polyketide cyclase/dehydrase n=1 Tax=Saccharomycopsis crataegensis TaxID=43959 RepID=A0AAV5QJC8_9ASCO|nr:hypothetical protein DASC09_023900 [Saccharomycopsis crataegensis]